jgi:pimeloyl-ACP methyl ester carboxylesterase
MERKGSAPAKQVTPVVMLHDYKETRGVFNSFARRLQAPTANEPPRPSFAVIAVDLRAHGDSTRQIFPDGSQVDLDASKLNRDELLAMAALDMEAVRGFLIVKNDSGELNLNKLCLLGAGMGASVAANWAMRDWAAPPLAVVRQGQDVKGLVLLSPRWTFRGLSMQQPMRFAALKEYVAWMLVYGEQDSRVKADVNRIERQLEPFHPESQAAGTQRPRGLAMVAWPSNLQGSKLLSKVGAPIEDQIIEFLVLNVAGRGNQPWNRRLDKLP